MAYSGKSSIYCLPKLDRLNFSIWKVKMTVFLNFLGSRLAKAICKHLFVPRVIKTHVTKLPLRNIFANSKAHYSLLQALNDDDVSTVINYTCTYDI